MQMQSSCFSFSLSEINPSWPRGLSIVLRRILAIRRLDVSKSTLSTIELVARVVCASLKLNTRSDRLVATESLAHVNQAALAFSISLLQLLASSGKHIDKWRAKAIGGGVALDHDTVALLETFG
jgi:hypothetical protein